MSKCPTGLSLSQWLRPTFSQIIEKNIVEKRRAKKVVCSQLYDCMTQKSSLLC